MKKKKVLKGLSIVLSCAMLAGTVPVQVLQAADAVNYLTDANGNARTEAGEVVSQNHEIIDINIKDGETHKISVYLLDKDNSGRWSMVDMIDPDTQKLMDSQNVYDFSEGVYLSWNVSGHVQLRLTNVWTKRYKNSKDTAIQGIFIDGEDAVKKGVAKVKKEKATKNHDAKSLKCVNILGRFASAGEDFTDPLDKEVQSVEMRFDGTVDPSNKNIDQIKVLKDGKEVPGTMRTSFYSVTFQPETTSTMRDGNYEIVIPATVKNTAGEELGQEYRTKFAVDTEMYVTYMRDGMNYQERRVDVSFNDRIEKIDSPATLVYDKDGENHAMTLKNNGYGQGAKGGRFFHVLDKIIPSGSYTFTLPKGVHSLSGAVSEEDYVNTFDFESTQLSAKIEAPKVVGSGKNFDVIVKECYGYGEVRYALSENALKNAAYQPVTEKFTVKAGDSSEKQTLYVQFRVKAGKQKGTESPVLHQAFKAGELEVGAMLPFDMQSAGAYDKDGFGSVANPTDGVFDLPTEVWENDAGNYTADGPDSFSELYDQDKDGKVTTEKGIEYQLSSGLYKDGAKNVATGNGKTIPAPSKKSYEKIYVLAAGKHNADKGTFVMNYTDGTSTTQEVTAHYWGDDSNGENVVFRGLRYCVGWWGEPQYMDGAVMRQYELIPDANKTLESVTLPKNKEENINSVLFRVFAMTGKEADTVKGQAITPFDMQSAGAYTKDGFGSVANPTDGVFDLATEEWCEEYCGPNGTSNYIADGDKGFSGLYDQDKDGKVTTAAGIEYQLSTGLYKDGAKNVATGNGVTVPAPAKKQYDKIFVLAAGKHDSDKGTFTMNYADGTNTTQEIEANYWGGENEPIENIVFKDINMCAGWWNNEIWQGAVMRQYELIPDEGKVLESVTLPNTSNLIRVFAMSGREAVFGNEKNLTAYTAGEFEKTAEEKDMTAEEFETLYGKDAVLAAAADTTDVTEVTNVEEILPGDRTYDPEILKEQETKTGGYGDSMYPFARQAEKLMSYKIRMQIYDEYELDFEDALESIRRVDNLSRGIEKKCYLVGWQMNGHDTGFPYFGEVNPRHKRPMDETSLESLKWLIKEAKEKYHTTITLHINLSDAYTDDDPISNQMLKDQLAIREKNGSVRPTGYWAGHKGYSVSAYGNYFTGNFQKNQMDPLVAMLPELEGQSVHPDAWYSWADPYYGLTSFETTDAQRRSAMYMREKYGMDITTEFDVEFGAGAAHPEDHVLYFSMIWQHGWGETNPLMVPSYFQTGVNETTWDGQHIKPMGRYFGEGSAVEPNVWGEQYGPITMPGLKQSFAEKELTRQYFNTLLRNSLTDDPATGGQAVMYTDDGQKVVSAWNGNDSTVYKRTVTVGDDVVLQEPGNVFMPMTWRSGREIQAWSKDGYTGKTWKLPVEWEGVEQVDLYDLNLEGLRHVATKDVADRTFTMDMAADQTMVIVPAGQNPNSQEGFAQNGTVQFLGRDTKTGSNWTEKYGSEGYDIYEVGGEAGLPEEVEISYVNATVNRVGEPALADKEDLVNLIEYAKSQQENEDYKYLVPVVKEAFEKALAEAVAVNDNADATQDEVDAAYDNLLEMLGYLDFTGNSESLKVLVDAAKVLNEKLYTPETWKVLADALAKAEAVLADENALQAEIDAAAAELQAAMDGLVKIPVDKSKLQKLVDKSKKYEDKIAEYTPATADIFKGALAHARDILASDDVTQEEIDAAYAALQNAIFQLRLIPNKDKLEDLINKAEKVDTSKYTAESVAVFNGALAKAKAVFADVNATEEDVKAVEKELKSAQKGLVAKADADDDKDNNGNNGNGNGNNKDGDKNTNNGNGQPKTGDTASVAGWMTTVLLALGAVVVSVRRKLR